MTKPKKPCDECEDLINCKNIQCVKHLIFVLNNTRYEAAMEIIEILKEHTERAFWIKGCEYIEFKAVKEINKKFGLEYDDEN